MSTVQGIDVSRWNGLANLSSQAFQIARATYGTTPDAKYLAHTANAHTAGIVTGAYHFGVGGNVAGQVDAFLARAGTVDLYALDLEQNGGGPDMTNDEAALFIRLVKGKGKRIGLYHSRWRYPNLGQTWNWIADWDSSTFPTGSHLWQYQGNPIDRDKFNGTPAQFAVFVGHAPVAITYRVIISGYTTLYDKPYGKRVGAVTAATYLCTRSKVGGSWWYRILRKASGASTANAGRYFQPNRHVEAHLA